LILSGSLLILEIVYSFLHPLQTSKSKLWYTSKYLLPQVHL